MSRLIYRHAKPEDLAFIVGIGLADAVVAFDDDPAAGDPAYLAALAAIDADPNHELYVAELAGEAVGTMQLSFLPGILRRGMWCGLIEGVHVSPQHRNLGLGSDMIRWAIERCRARGCGRVQLTSNKLRHDAHRFYRRLGFEQSHEGFKLYL